MYIEVSAFVFRAINKRMEKKALTETVDDNAEVSRMFVESTSCCRNMTYMTYTILARENLASRHARFSAVISLHCCRAATNLRVVFFCRADNHDER